MRRINLSRLGFLTKILRSSILLIILSVIIVIFGFSEFYINDPASNVICSSCHSMTPFRDTWLTSPHQRLSCYTCHETGIAELANELYVYVAENPHPSDIEEGKLLLVDPCLTCHKPESLQTKVKLHTIHWGLIVEVETCTLCHTSHFLTPPKEACLGCHGNERSAEIHEEFHIEANSQLARGVIICANCHSTAAKWMIPLNRPSILGAVAGQDCFDCHSAPLRTINIRDRNCLDCHGRVRG